jgi:hypothetical protein
MNKKELAALRKEFKEDSYKLHLNEIYSVYLKKDGCDAVFAEMNIFEAFDSEKKELYFENFKKLLSTSLDTKSFELEFMNEYDAEEENTRTILYNALNNEDKSNIHESFDKVIAYISQNYKYDTDVVVTFVLVDYLMSVNEGRDDYDEGQDDSISKFNFVICSVNKVEFPKKNIIFDYINQRLVPNSSTEVIINLHAPIEGFMFPSISNGYSDISRVLYYTQKAQELEGVFVQNVLECKTKLTAKNEKECFHNILATVVGEKIKPEFMQDVYEELAEKVEEDEEVETISKEDIKSILETKGIEVACEVDDAFEQICGEKKEFRAENILPKFNNKSIKISSGTLDISISPSDLASVKQIRGKDGKKYLKIEITEDMDLNGLILETEEE